MLSRKTQTTVLRQDWLEIGDVRWLTVWTSETGSRSFHLIGLPSSEYNMGKRWPSLEAKYAVGNIIEVGALNTVPTDKGEWLACIRPGVNLHIGLMDDGLWDICGPLAFARIVNMTSGDAPDFAEYRKVALAAIAALLKAGKAQAKKVLKSSGKFTSVYNFNIGGPALNVCFEVER